MLDAPTAILGRFRLVLTRWFLALGVPTHTTIRNPRDSIFSAGFFN